MSYYVRRDKPGTPGGHAYVGPIKTERQAYKEVDAWNGSDPAYNAVALVSTPVVRSYVRAWQKAVRERRGVRTV